MAAILLEVPDPRNSLLKSEINARRSQRVVARIKIQVQRSVAVAEKEVSEVSYTLVVNAHGALVSLTMDVEPKNYW